MQNIAIYACKKESKKYILQHAAARACRITHKHSIPASDQHITI